MMPSNIMDLTGHIYGRLTVLEYSHSKKYYHKDGRVSSSAAYWKCRCSCGKEIITSGNGMRTGHTTSCKCSMKGRISPARKAPGVAAANYLMHMYKGGAKARGLEFSLTLDQLLDIGGRPCYYCGALPKPYNNRGKSYSSVLFTSIDRVDSDKGYILNNCLPCCSDCNYAKSDMKFEEFRDWVLRVANRLQDEFNLYSAK